MADASGVSGATVVAVAVLGASATIAASAIAVFGHWLADKRLGRHDLARSRQDVYARYLSVQQRWLEGEKEFAFLLDQTESLKAKQGPSSYLASGNAAVKDQIVRDLLEMRARVRQVREDSAVALYAVILLAGPGLRDKILSSGGRAADEARDQEVSADGIRTHISEIERHIIEVEEAMRRELNP